MGHRVAPEPLDPCVGDDDGFHLERTREEVCRDAGLRDARELGPGVHAAPLVLGHAALQTRELRYHGGRTVGEVGTVEDDGLVWREEGQVVPQHPESVVADFSVG